MARCHRMLAAVLAAGLHLGSGVAPASATAAVTLSAGLGWTCVNIWGTPSTAYTVSLLEGTAVLDTGTKVTDGSGFARICFNTEVVAGLKLKVQKSGYSRTVTVPTLGINAERGSDVISGAAPAGKSVDIRVERLQTGTFEPGPALTRTVTASAGDTFSVDWTGDGGIRGGDFVEMSYGTEAGDYFSVRRVVEQMRIIRNSARVLGAVDPGVVEIELQNATGGVRARARLAATVIDGDASAAFLTMTGVLRSPRVGDKVVGDLASDAIITVPAITASRVAWSDVVTITCPGMAGQGVDMYARKDDYSDQAARIGVTNASGVASWDLSADIDLGLGDVIFAFCRYDSGDEIGVYGRVGA